MAKKILLKILGGAERKRIKQDCYKNYSYKSIGNSNPYKIISEYPENIILTMFKPKLS